MTPRWEEVDEPPPEPKGPLFMDAVLTPNRSLSRRAFRWLIVLVAGANAIASIGFILSGAYPVAGFLALDVALLWWAFHLNYRAGRALERVQVAADRLHVERSAGRGRPAHFVVHPHWARVSAAPEAVRVAAGGRMVKLGAFLSPEERAAFAEALAAALARARRGDH